MSVFMRPLKTTWNLLGNFHTVLMYLIYYLYIEQEIE